MNPTRRILDAVDVPLPGNRTLRVALYRTPEGEPEALVLAAGWGEGREWREDRTEGLTLPAEVLPAITAALNALHHIPK
jgi:hypothetical protein